MDDREPWINDAPEATTAGELRVVDDELAAIITRLATDGACTGLAELAVRFHRITAPTFWRKTLAVGPTLTVVARGRKRAWFPDRELVYDEANYIVNLGETTFDSEIAEATPARPYLAVSLELPIDAIVKMQLALPPGERVAPSSADDAPTSYVGPFDPVLRGTVIRLLRAMEDPVERRVLVPLLSEELVFRLLRCDAAQVVRPPVVARDAQVIQRAMQYIRDNATRSLSVQAIARHVAMSPSHFAHRFREVAHTTPMRFLKRARLDAAREALRAGPLRVAELATRVGYESTSHFSRDFKLAFGVTPAELARRYAGSGASPAEPGIVAPPRSI